MYNKDRFKIYIQVQIKIYLYCLLAGSVSIHFFVYNWILICRNQNYYRKSQFEVWEICKFWILQNFLISIPKLSLVWEICKFWILQNILWLPTTNLPFERYVNFEFYKTIKKYYVPDFEFERYVNFEFYKTKSNK